MKVRRNTLLLIAALVWSAAGFNILRIGLLAYPPYRTVVNYLLSALVFTVFQVFIFGQLVNKHTARISAYEEELHFFLKFFDVKSFIIMAVMMTGGIWLRSSGVAPDRFIAFFYTGLGASLLLAGLLFRRRERLLDAVYLVPLSGGAEQLDMTLRELSRERALPVVLVDCGLTAAGRQRTELLTGGAGAVLVTPQQLTDLYTKKENEQGR
mgnify:CR=1 FL=1